MAVAEHLEPRIRVPISELQPSLDTKNSFIRGIVTLIWPYSSSKGSLSLLIAEPDFRLRRQRGQIRVTFTGSSAKLVARSGVSSGDGLVLGLTGVQWAKDQTTLSTPGKGSEWELSFGERAVLQIDSELRSPVSLDIDHPTLSPPPQVQPPMSPRSPTASESLWVPNTRTRVGLESQVWSSPAFLKRGRLSSASYLKTVYDPFLEEDGYLEGMRRKRTKFGRESGQWRYTERTPSPDRESEADVHEGNQHGNLGSAGDKLETTTSLENNLDLQESKPRERDIEIPLESSLAAPVEEQTSDTNMLGSAVIAERGMTERESSFAAIPINHAVEGPVVSGSQQELPIETPHIHRSLSARSLPVMRESLLTAEELEVVAEGATDIVVESGSSSQADAFPEDHTHSADAQHVAPRLEHLLPQVESPPPSSSCSASPDFEQNNKRLSYASELDEPPEQPLVSGSASDDDHMDTAAGAQNQSVATESNQQEVTRLIVAYDTLNAQDTISGVLPGVPQTDHLLELAIKDVPFSLDGGAFSQPTVEDTSLGDRWDHVAAASKNLEIPKGVPESRNSPTSHHSDTSPIEIEDDVADLTAPTDGLGTTESLDQQMAAVPTDDDVNKFAGSLALDNKSKRHLGSGSPKISHVVDVKERFRPSNGIEEEEEEAEEEAEEGEGQGNEYSEGEEDEPYPEDENSQYWQEGSDDESIQLEEYSSYESDEPEVEGQVPLLKPPIEIIDLDGEDDEEEAESLQGDSERPYDHSLPDIPSSEFAGSVASQMLETNGSRAQDIISKDIASSGILIADDIHAEDALPEDSESPRVLEADEVHDDHGLSVASESSRVMIADNIDEEDSLSVYSSPSKLLGPGEGRGEDSVEDVLSMNSEPSQDFGTNEDSVEDVLSMNSEPSLDFETNEDRGRDALSMDSEPSRVFKTDEGFQEDVSFVDSEPPQVLVENDPPEQDVISVDSEFSQVLEVVGDRGEDALPMDGERQHSGLYQAQQLVANIASPELGVPSPAIDTSGVQVSLVEHQAVHLPVQVAQTETSQMVRVEIKQVIESSLPDTDVTSGGPGSTLEADLPQHILGPKLRNQLATPDATQPIHASSQLSSVFLRSLNRGQDLPTPRPTQGSSTNRSQLDATLHHQGASLLEKLNELRKSSGNRSHVRSESSAASAITPWFTPKRPSQVAPKSASEDESDHGDDESDDSGLESEHSDVKSDSDSDHRKVSEAAVGNPGNHQIERVTMSTQPGPPLTGLRTSLSYFAPLASLESHFGSTLDVTAVVVKSTRTSRAKTGPRDYHVTIHLADPSTTTSSSVHPTAISIFRPFKKALPLAQPGDAVLLRDFKVQRRKQRIMLLSTNSSAWAVFRTGEEAQIRGPPVEYGAAERGFVRGLRDWWGSLAAEIKEELRKQAPKDGESDEGKGRWVDGKHELRDGTTYTDVPAEERNAIHELRDGTTYVDEDL